MSLRASLIGLVALANLAVFGALYLVICIAIGLLLAIFLDQKIRGEGVLRLGGGRSRR